MSYRIEILSSATKDLHKLPNNMVSRVRAVLQSLGDQPRPVGSQKLVKVDPETWRVRIGDWRVLYRIDDTQNVVKVVTVAHRREAYRKG